MDIEIINSDTEGGSYSEDEKPSVKEPRYPTRERKKNPLFADEYDKYYKDKVPVKYNECRKLNTRHTKLSY